MDSEQRIALIPARGGSKRLPGKNIVDFMGKPIIAWTIAAARETGLFMRVIVSTDDDKIGEIARAYGAEIEPRAPHLALDSASALDLCLDYAGRMNDEDVLCCLFATAPLRRAEDIAATVNLLQPGMCDFSAAVTHYGLPVHQALWRKPGGAAAPVFPDLVRKQSNDVPEIVVDNGSTYAMRVGAFLKERTFFGSNFRGYLMPRERSQDIDEAIDLELARFFAGREGRS